MFPSVRLVAHYIPVGSLMVDSVVSLNPVTICLAIHIVTEIYENYMGSKSRPIFDPI